ncbi:MAG: hypothetical protein IJX39_06230 [Clostridia bacterium]|nr:hypothetical protein [Clostridia bacterium]MBQ8357392.1 hypothetical protein [Clostridia bacterium]
MHRFSAPVALDTVTEEAYPLYLSQFRAAGIDRVVICGVGEIKEGKGAIFEEPDRVECLIRRLREDGFEVCVWVNALGHGGLLSHAGGEEPKDDMGFTPIVGLDGRWSRHGLCPLDPKLRAHYARSLQIVAAMHPDLIMLDDDFRLNVRDGTYDIGCFCHRHMAALGKRVGKTLSREEWYEKAFTGGENPYRSAWMDLMAESLLGFAREMRAAVDAVDPTMRLGTCMCYDTWDMDGTDGIALAQAFAGQTKPFLRTIGAPYHDPRVAAAVESTRMQAAWCRGSGIEVLAEGDVYPRPRYNVPAARLELFDLALLATGAVDGDQKYMFDYVRRAGYENGYVDRHLKNTPVREEISDIFAGKTPVGVQVFESMHKVREWDLPAEKKAPAGRYIHKGFHSRAARLLAEHAIPAAYGAGEYPVILFGENARHLDLSLLGRGAVLDAGAARILTQRGVDVGLLSAQTGQFSGEYYIREDDTVNCIGAASLMRLTVAPSAEAESLLLPDRSPGSYTYENANGQRFFVLAWDAYGTLPTPVTEYQNNYYRGSQLVRAIEWAGRKPLPAVCTGHPYLYMICAENAENNTRSVALFNCFEDEVLSPVVTLDRDFSHIRFVNCTGELRGNTVLLSDIPPFGTAAFEVK